MGGVHDLDPAHDARPAAERDHTDFPLRAELEQLPDLLVRLREQDNVRGRRDRSEAEAHEVAVRTPDGVIQAVGLRQRDPFLADDLPEDREVGVREPGGGQPDSRGVRHPQRVPWREFERMVQEREEGGLRLQGDGPVLEAPTPPLRGPRLHRARDSPGQD